MKDGTVIVSDDRDTVSDSYRQKINTFPTSLVWLGRDITCVLFCRTTTHIWDYLNLLFQVKVKGWFRQYKKKATVKQPRFWLRPVHPPKAELRKDKIVKMYGKKKKILKTFPRALSSNKFPFYRSHTSFL